MHYTLALMILGLMLSSSGYSADEPIPAKAIQDNSFLVEEAYNQERGVVQHIFTAQGTTTRHTGPDDHDWEFSFTQEWPFLSQKHQLSYTIPYSLISSAGEYVHGVGDVLLNYRYQALFEDATTPAFAPRFSLIVPTGDPDQGLGNDQVGYQVNLPVSKVVGYRWTVHGNAGGTITPGVQGEDPRAVNLGFSAIYAATDNFNLMLETVGQWSRQPMSTGGSEHLFAAVISPGVRGAINLQRAQMVLGLAVPVGLTPDAADYGVYLYFSFEHPFLADAEF